MHVVHNTRVCDFLFYVFVSSSSLCCFQSIVLVFYCWNVSIKGAGGHIDDLFATWRAMSHPGNEHNCFFAQKDELVQESEQMTI